MNKVTLAFLLGCLTVLAACTKEVPYKMEYKEEELSKSSIDTKGDYIYTASALEASRYTSEGRPFWFGDTKRVRLEWTETSLKVMEKERDERFAAPVNDKLILEIPVTHIDYECAKDAYGDCTGSETQKKTNWANKANFKIKPAAAKQGALEPLPILMDEAMGSNCYKEVSSEVQGYEVTDEAINLQVKRNYMQNLDCMKEIDNSLTETNISAVFHYSLVKTKAVLSSDFKPVSYRKLDENTFGFFSSTYKKRDIDLNPIENSEKTVMNHWNPNRTNIDFHLSDSFNKPQNKVLKQLSYTAIEKMNEGLKKAGAKFQITLHEPSGKNPGDIRNSMIVLVEDPYEAAPLGYGPQTEDPITGEIISARTIMYSAGLQQYVKVNYDDIGRAYKRELAKKAAAAEAEAKAKEETPVDHGLIIEDGTGESASANIAKMIRMPKARIAVKDQGAARFTDAQIKLLEREGKIASDYTSRVNEEYSKRDAKAYLKYLTEAKNCTYRAEPSTGVSEVRPELMKQIIEKYSENGELIPWMKLSEGQKQEVMDLLIAEVYLPVLLHELGHNMGLRHNFKGSEDKASWYDTKELAAIGVNHEIPYSTIMEYGDDLRTLPILGKYDIAALKFGYARKVDVIQNGQVQEVSIATDLTDLQSSLTKANAKLVPYGYCTDENVGPNPGCRRFDEGTTYEQIADYLISSYLDRYEARNTRSGRENFSAAEDVAYAARQYQRFMEMRVFTEYYERVKHIFGVSDAAFDAPNLPAWIVEMRNAMLKTNRLMMKVIRTPDLHCAVGDEKGNFLGVLALNVIDKNAFDCSDADYDFRFPDRKFKTIGQTGKSLNNKKAPTNQSDYIDQIDVRGYWLDKWAAARVLFARNINASSNQNLDNAWDIETLRPELQEMLTAVIENKSVTEEEFLMIDGSIGKAKAKFDFHSGGGLINQPLLSGIAKALGVPNSNFYLSGVIAGMAVREAGSSVNNLDAGSGLIDLVSVKRTSSTDWVGKELEQLTIGPLKLFATPENAIAQSLFIDIKVQKQIGQLSDENLEKLQALVKGAETTAVTEEALAKQLPELTADQKTFLVGFIAANPKLALERVNALLTGMMMPEAEIRKILVGLP